MNTNQNWNPQQQPQGPNPHYLGTQYMRPQQMPPAKPKKSRTWIWVVSALVGGMIVGSAAAGGGGSEAAPASIQTVTATATVKADGKPAQNVTVTAPAVTVTAPAPETTKAAEKPAGNVLNDGIHVVGSEAPAGRYTTTVPEGAILCYYARLKSDDGSMDAIITNGMFNEGAKGSFTIKEGDKFIELSGGCEWTRV